MGTVWHRLTARAASASAILCPCTPGVSESQADRLTECGAPVTRRSSKPLRGRKREASNAVLGFRLEMLPVSADGVSEERRRRERTRAHGASRGSTNINRWSPERGETESAGECVHDVSPLPGLSRRHSIHPRLTPWALVLSRLRRSSDQYRLATARGSDGL